MLQDLQVWTTIEYRQMQAKMVCNSLVRKSSNGLPPLTGEQACYWCGWGWRQAIWSWSRQPHFQQLTNLVPTFHLSRHDHAFSNTFICVVVAESTVFWATCCSSCISWYLWYIVCVTWVPKTCTIEGIYRGIRYKHVRKSHEKEPRLGNEVFFTGQTFMPNKRAACSSLKRANDSRSVPGSIFELANAYMEINSMNTMPSQNTSKAIHSGHHDMYLILGGLHGRLNARHVTPYNLCTHIVTWLLYGDSLTDWSCVWLT